MTMNNMPGFGVEKPVSVWNKPLNADFKKLFASLGKAGVKGSAQDWKGAASDLVDAAAAVGFKNNLPQVAWTLIFRAASTALETLVLANQASFTSPVVCPDPDHVAEKVASTLEECTVRLDSDFFKRPGDLPFIGELRKAFINWLKGFGIDRKKAREITNLLRSEFEVAVHSEWTSGREEYEDLKKALLDNPFNEALKRNEAWKKHHQWLQDRTNARIFDEDFGISAVYIPLRAYYEERPVTGRATGDKVKRRVVDLADELEKWVDAADPSDAIRCVTGEPGAGKSSFSNMFAADMSKHAGIPVLFIPLHAFHVDKANDLIDAMARYVRMSPDLFQNPLDPLHGEQRLLIVFDGLDELSTSEGNFEEQLAGIFQHYLASAASRLNRSQPARILALVSGRELFIQQLGTQVIDDQRVLHILPYRIDQEPKADFKYDDPDDLLAEDQREKWWERYYAAKGLEYCGVPEEMNKGELLQLTGQPLLNYLIARMVVRGETDFSRTRNRNDVYRQIVNKIYERGWADAAQHASLQSVSERNFHAVLEAIAVGTWHGDGRKTTVARIMCLCNNDEFNNWVNTLREGAEKGIARLLIAFFFKSECADLRLDTDRPFEFTHKSFGEYLTARRIINELDRSCSNLKSESDRTEALKRWAFICGPASVDTYMLKFIRDEVAIREAGGTGTARKWQQYIAVLIGHMLREGMPMHALMPRADYPTEVKRARNAEEALLAVLNACSRVSMMCSEIDWPTKTAFGSWISQLRGQRDESEFSISMDCMSRLMAREQVLCRQELVGSDFRSADLVASNLVRTALREANLSGVNLSEANLSGADLVRSDLSGAILEKTNLFRAHLTGANLSEAILLEANLSGAKVLEGNLTLAHLTGANLTVSNMSGADLARADLRWADLSGANLKETNLSGAKLKRANFEKADLSRANLSEADLTVANLLSAKLIEANLSGTELAGAILEKAELPWASLSGANLSGADLAEAVLFSANLSDANLEDSDLGMADLAGANLARADLSSAKNLTQNQLDQAHGDSETKLPDGLTIKRCPQKRKGGSTGSETTRQ